MGIERAETTAAYEEDQRRAGLHDDCLGSLGGCGVDGVAGLTGGDDYVSDAGIGQDLAGKRGGTGDGVADGQAGGCTSNGQVSGPALLSNATLPLAEINTLADIVERCVNSAGGSASDTTDGQTNGTGCGKLFFLAGGTSTTDTVTAAMVIAQNPACNVAKLN